MGDTIRDLARNNPARGIERHTEVSRERMLSDAEVRLFWSAFDESGMAGTALQVFLLTGQRPGEIAPMRREHYCRWMVDHARGSN